MKASDKNTLQMKEASDKNTCHKLYEIYGMIENSNLTVKITETERTDDWKKILNIPTIV